MAESNDLSLLSGTGPKRRSDQSQKGDEKWTHLGNDDDLTNGAKTSIFNPDGVFGVHYNAIGVKSGPICWRCYGHCRHIHTVRTVRSRATRNPSRSVIGCNPPSGVERVCHAAGRFGKGRRSRVGDDSSTCTHILQVQTKKPTGPHRAPELVNTHNCV